jgi:hypothetical protein
MHEMKKMCNTATKPHATYYQDCQPIPNQPQKGLAATLAAILENQNEND